jgi:hypothetical protein
LRRTASFDVSVIFRAVAVLLRSPVIVLAPLAASMCNAALSMVANYGNSGGVVGSIGGSIWQLVFFLIDCFGVGVALIAADAAWRHGRVSFDDAFDDAKRKAGDILMASVGLNFVLWAAALVGGFITQIAAVLAGIAAVYFFIYTLPAAAIGGVPGSVALQISIERVKSNYAGAAIPALVVVAAFFATIFIDSGALAAVVPFNGPPFAFRLIEALVESIVMAYVAVVLAKTYSDVSFTPPRW